MSEGKKIALLFGYYVIAIMFLVFVIGYVKAAPEVYGVLLSILGLGVPPVLVHILFPPGKSDDSSDDD